ncbi:MAG TPA: HEAT repeat domain-containing protein, partial [Prosthecobacter sp.]|nr:HEAT repeat domain-containing protein [Prosthecobacter sp.]
MVRLITAALLLPSLLHAQADLDAYISTGDNHWLGSSLPVDSARSIEDTFEFLNKVCAVKRVYWRGLEEATWVQTFDERPENCRYYSFWQWIRRLYRDVDPDVLAAQAARKRGMELWGVATMFDWGAQADTPGFGDYPNNSESRLRLQHPEWVPIDRHGFRRQGGPIELAYPEARKALVDLHAAEMRRVGYDGLVFLTYLENYSLRFQDEFGFSPPIVDEFQKRVRQDLLKVPFSRTASREDWLRIRGGFVTDYLRELKAELAKDRRQLGLFVDPHDIRQPQPWNVPETMRTAGAHHMDLETWVRDGVVDLLAVYGYCAPQLQDAAVRDCRWLVRDTATKVSVLTSSPMVEKWQSLRKEGVRTVMSVSEDVHFASRGPVPEQVAEALSSGDLARVCKALAQVIEGKLAAEPSILVSLAKDGNLIQRRLALQALALTKDAAVLPVIEAALDDPENGIRCMAAHVLRTLNGDSTVPALLAAVTKHGNHPLREVAANTLMGLKPFPRELIHETLAESNNPHVRTVVLRALSPQ